MSLSILVLDFLATLSEYLQRSTLSSLRARSVPASYSAGRGALYLSVRPVLAARLAANTA